MESTLLALAEAMWLHVRKASAGEGLGTDVLGRWAAEMSMRDSKGQGYLTVDLVGLAAR